MQPHEIDEIPPGDPFLVMLFQMPKDPDAQTRIQDRFFLDKEFWKPYLAKMFLWTKPLGLSKTETPDGQPALALLMEFTDDKDILFAVGQEIAEALRLPAFAVSLTFLEEDEQRELRESTSPF